MRTNKKGPPDGGPLQNFIRNYIFLIKRGFLAFQHGLGSPK